MSDLVGPEYTGKAPSGRHHDGDGTTMGRGRRRGRLRRPVAAAPPAPPRPVRTRLRGGRRRRRHLVLEPLPRRPLRRREPRLLLFLLRRTAAGMAMERALRLAAGDPALPRARRR